MILRPPASTVTVTLFPCTTLSRSGIGRDRQHRLDVFGRREAELRFPRLARAEDFSRPAQPQVLLGDAKAVVRLPHQGQPCARRFGKRLPAQQQAHRAAKAARSEEHTSELQSLMRLSYAVFCLKKKT